MAFTPALTTLGTVYENTNISYTITYMTADVVPVALNVVITKLETNPSTIVVSGGTISGYYFDSFDNSIKYRTKTDTFVTVPKFEQIDRSVLSEMVSFKASTVHYKNFTYRADAMNINGTVADSQVYTIIVSNDWTAGRDNLKTYVGYTHASS
ncbi:hypothetical protein UFOVP240_210 [uncultured Caudovirales phage]|uniref:Uncharacterized protein n=1 Tax=uncultured Caudovirales phage TaxID=2100421 RepID=A0A6J7WXJ2_9CAUD|nr:hypothetical protein UFOVP240_210 [uncultured Caudovirales phage]